MNKISNLSLMIAAAVGFAVMPSVVMGQDLATDVAAPAIEGSAVEAPVRAAPLTGPRNVQAGITRSAAATTTAPLLQNPASRRDVSWMVIGGAAIVVGSVVGGDGGQIITVTGAVVGLIGLWRYLQYS